MNLTNFAKSYNNQSYQVILNVFTTDISLTSPQNIEYDLEKSTLIPSEDITYIMMENSMIDVIPKAKFEIIDNSLILTPNLKKENTRFKLTIIKEGLENTESIKIETMWIVKKFEILSVKTTGMHYSIDCELDIATSLYSICEYATENPLSDDIDAREDPIEIAKILLKNSGIKLYNEESKNADGTIVSNRYTSPKSGTVISFITNQNMFVMDALNYLLSLSIGTLDIIPPPYFIYNLKDAKGFITTRENLFKESSIEQQPNSSRLDFCLFNKPVSKQYQINDLSLNCVREDIGGIENSKLFFNHNFYSYSHNERLWENSKISKFNIDEILTKGCNGSYHQSLYLKSGNEDMEMANYYQYPTIYEHKIYDVLKYLELYSSNIQFTIDGIIDLDVGHVINVDEATSENRALYEAINGKWMIIKIRHTFNNKEYKTNLICSRTYYSKAL